VVLDLDLPARVTEPDPRVDAVRGCVAVERGPLVYCVETADVPPGATVEDLRWDPARAPVEVPRPDLGDGVVGVTVPVVRRPGAGATADGATADGADADRAAADGQAPDGHAPDGAALSAGAIPYFAWANRGAAAMRVWIPR
jgi:DUF1680 family protein